MKREKLVRDATISGMYYVTGWEGLGRVRRGKGVRDAEGIRGKVKEGGSEKGVYRRKKESLRFRDTEEDWVEAIEGGEVDGKAKVREVKEDGSGGDDSDY